MSTFVDLFYLHLDSTDCNIKNIRLARFRQNFRKLKIMATSLCDELLQYQPSNAEAASLYSCYMAGCILNALLSCTTIVMNILTIHAMRKTSSLPKPLKTLLLSLAVSDLGVGLLVQPFTIALMVKWVQQINPNCTTYAAFTEILSLFTFASFFSVTALSVDRFLAVHLHLRYQELVTHKRVAAVVISSWMLSVFLALLLLWTPTLITYVVFAVIEVSCLATTTLLNYKLYSAVLRHRNQIETIHHRERRRSESIRKSAVGAFYVYLVFMACYLPQISSYVIISITGQSTVIKGVSVYTLTLVFLNSSLNPVIYCWKMRHIRHSIMDILRNAFPREFYTENVQNVR